ncbi:cysteine hydrolase family protein [Auraticoccus cholistanensis]|uniref:cysteine hydrolase family protein n=1 Tax=Auraticoccus cholistanensis TaxID=2656650 RepID=UPI0018D2112F|nr:isochorismatase family cysteine hydrolase [Auraticoccus cholistanensis]
MRALVVIDLQQDLCLGVPELDSVVQRVNALAARAREEGAPVFEVRTTHLPDGSTWALNMRDDGQGMALRGSEGWGPVPGLELPGAQLVEKTRDDAFLGTDLADRLRGAGVDAVVLCGVTTEACVAVTGASAYGHDLRVVVAEDAVASSDDEAHIRALKWLEEQYRAELVRSDQVRFTG